MKHATVTIVTVAAIASLAGCAAPVSSSSEETGLAEQASTTGGISATITAQNNGSQYQATVMVTNNGNGNASNWQVALNMPNATLANVSGAEANIVGGVLTFNPGVSGTTLWSGSNYRFTFNANIQGSFVAPTIASVDGEANGTAGLSPDGVDHIARTAASGALGVAFSYENDKLANTGDPNYALYDGLVWAAQSYVVSNGQIVFDPNVPGYKFIPQQAMAALATIQQDPSVASYLVNGLQSCFTGTNGQMLYYFRASTLDGFPTNNGGSVAGGPVPPGNWTPSPYNPVDTYTVATAPLNAGAETITVTEGSSNDYWFGMVTSTPLSAFANTGAVAAKFSGQGQVMCSPFNGPGGGTANPYLVVTLNGQNIGARQQLVGSQCQNGCTSTIVLDPIAYTIPGPQYDGNNNLIGPQNNPFTLDPTDVYADPTHYMQFSTNPAAQYGTFSKTLTLLGSPVEKWLLCGTSGSGC